MTDSTEQLRKVKSIFEQAIDLKSTAEREAFLNKACAGLDDLRADVESLLAEHDAADDFLDTPAALPGEFDGGDLSEADALAWLPDDRMIDGRYHVDGVIAIGGMGVVYEATQSQPKRKVALKIMRRGLVSRAIRRRFQYEAETLARLHHPHIAQVYDAGVHYLESVRENGDAMPYFAMEFVEGAQSITDFAKSNSLSIDERIRLFIDACRAIQHGHQRGIIHRDIKPANILVDAQGCVKVIDFGVARITDADVAVTTMQTGVGEIVGTVQYMSPEQCAGDPHEIDVRSDVYSLGLVLYEQLTDELPYDLSGMSIVRAVQAVQEQMPRRLSTIYRKLRGDLEVILEQAVAKDRSQRYQSAAQLCDELQRYLNGEPIFARRPTLWIRMSAWAGRHPVATASLLSLMCVITIMATSMTLFWHERRQPSTIRLSEAGRSAWLVNSLGEPLLTFGSESAPRRNVQVEVVDRPSHLGGGRVAFILVRTGQRSTDGQLWMCPLVDMERPEWKTNPHISTTHPKLPDEWSLPATSPEFVVFDFAVGDFFKDTPAKEVAVVHGHVRSSPNVVRIYDLNGTVLFEAWHLGSLLRIAWWKDARLLICQGNRHGRRDVGRFGYKVEESRWPPIALAIQPRRGIFSGWINESGWPEQWRSDANVTAAVEWYKTVFPPDVAQEFHSPITPDTSIGSAESPKIGLTFLSDNWGGFTIHVGTDGRALNVHYTDAFVAPNNPFRESRISLADWPPPVDDEDQ